MISEYLLIICFLSLSLILFISATGFKNAKNIVLLRNVEKSEILRKKNARLELWYRLIVFFISVLVIFRSILIFYSPSEFLSLSYIPKEIVHHLLINLILIIFWIVILYFFYIKGEIRLDERYVYLKGLYSITVFIALTDVIFSTALYYTSFSGFFLTKSSGISPYLTQLSSKYVPLLWIHVLLLFLSTGIFILFILKRAIRILKQYWISLLMLFIVGITFTLLSTVNNLGWNESTVSIMSLFSLNYMFLGWIVLGFLAASILCNALAVLVFSMLNKFTNQAKFKTYVITLVKMGFTTAITFAILVLLPELILWIYS